MPKKTASTPSDTEKLTESKSDPAKRSILVSDSSAEPADNQAANTDTPAVPATAPVVNRTAKTIQPISAETKLTAPEPVAVIPHADTHELTETEPDSQKTVDTDTKPVVPPVATPTEASPDPVETATSDTEQSEGARQVELDKQLAAVEARNQELEAMIISGKYTVPINAVHRKRSRVVVSIALVLMVVAAVAVLDVLADTGTLKLPSSVPHSHLFTNK